MELFTCSCSFHIQIYFTNCVFICLIPTNFHIVNITYTTYFFYLLQKITDPYIYSITSLRFVFIFILNLIQLISVSFLCLHIYDAFIKEQSFYFAIYISYTTLMDLIHYTFIL